MRHDGITFRRNPRITFRYPAEGSYLEFFYRRTGKQIPVQHGKTNLGYREDGGVLLALDGQVYSAPPVARRVTQTHEKESA